jgi:hypothetical protein
MMLGGSVSNCTNAYFWIATCENMPTLINYVNPNLHKSKLLKTTIACIQEMPGLYLSQGTDYPEVSKIFLSTSMQIPGSELKSGHASFKLHPL